MSCSRSGWSMRRRWPSAAWLSGHQVKPYLLSDEVAEVLRQSRQRIVITGAGGWLGLATLELLRNCLDAGLSQRVHCYGSRARTLVLTDGTAVEQRPLAELSSLPQESTLLLHLAFLTKDRAEAMDEAEYVIANRALSGQVLEALDPIGAEAVFVASSGAASFADDPATSAAMRLYGTLKKEDEEAFAAWAVKSGTQAVIGRIYNISGPHMNKPGNYALASFILAGLSGGPIKVQAPYPVVRGYVAIRELMSLVFALLLNENTRVVRFDSGGSAMELEQVAQEVGRALGTAVQRAALVKNDANIYAGDAASYQRLLMRNGVAEVSFAEQVIETIDFFRSHYEVAEAPAG